jgi:hypothetical protein
MAREGMLLAAESIMRIWKILIVTALVMGAAVGCVACLG